MRRADRRPIVVLLAVITLLAGCGSSASPTPTATATAAPTASPAAPTPASTASPTPSPSPAPPDPLVGKVVLTVTDDLVVRSRPWVGDDSAMYRPWLPRGTELRVLDGPAEGSGYTWYQVVTVASGELNGPRLGWVAMAGKDGEPWIALAGGPSEIELARAEVARAVADPAAAKTAAASIAAFGLDLYRALLADPSLGLAAKNAVFSPTSVAIALAMARAGARGETAAEMDAVLHTTGWDELGAGLNALEQALASRDASWRDWDEQLHELRLRIANAPFAQRDWSIEQAYLERIGATFDAGVRLVDYIADPEAARRLINEWVAAATAGRIPKLIPDPPPPVIDELTRLVLVNAMYLKANWETEFAGGYPVEPTTPRPFTTLDGSPVTVPTMSLHGGQIVPLASGSGWKATELRYRGADESTPLAMTMIRPDDLAAFEESLTPDQLASVVATLDAQRGRLQEVAYEEPGEGMDCGTYAYSVHLFMPRFSIDTAAQLGDPLKALGMPLAFDPAGADFTGIHVPEDPLDQLFIGSVTHQANIDVDEKGTEAAAATAVEMATGGCTGPDPAKTVTLRLDRPFLFLVRDLETGAILFMGRVVDPSVKP
jgi:serpin B